jgi:hypothetical protein
VKAVLKAVLPILAAAALVPAAQARTFASVVIGQPTITVSDLVRNDGITAAYREGGPDVIDFQYLLGPTPFTSEAVGRARTNEADDRISGRTTGRDARFITVADRYSPNLTFTVTPGTSVTVGFNYRLKTSIAGESYRGEQLPGDTANVELAVAAFNNFRTDEFGNMQYDFLSHEIDSATLESSTNPLRATLQRERGRLSATFENLSTDSAVFAFRAQMVAFGNSAPSFLREGRTDVVAATAPVPEPETYALMIAGLATVGWVTRRRRRQPKAAD